MKKILGVLLAIMLMCPVIALATADTTKNDAIDLSTLSYEELVALKNKVDLAIWESNDWQEVTVPYGVYVVGEDIPAGKWTIRAADGIYSYIKWGDVLDESGVDLAYSGEIYEYESVYSPAYKYYENGKDKTEITYQLKDGQYFIVTDGTVVFTPYAGKPSLGFK